MLPHRTHAHLLRADQTLLVVVDMQEPFLRTIFERERVVANVGALIQGATILRTPVLSTTQYREKMGALIPEIHALLAPLQAPFDKMSFSCFGSPAFASEVSRSGRKQILICGVETHICVSQTAHEMQAVGYHVQVAADAVSSRSESNWRLGLDRMRQAGILLTSVETALYEMLHEAGTPEFKQILKLIK